jgi:hypothetical protein
VGIGLDVGGRDGWVRASVGLAIRSTPPRRRVVEEPPREEAPKVVEERPAARRFTDERVRLPLQVRPAPVPAEDEGRPLQWSPDGPPPQGPQRRE